MEMNFFFQLLDPFLIWFYRLTGQAWVDFVIGTFFLAFLCLVIGEVTISLASRLTSKRLEQRTEEAAKYHYLAINALKAGNKEAYTAINKLANEAFGHTFFQQAALSAAFLWPIFFALAWMQHRFLEMEFPLPFIGLSLGYIGVFIIIYISAYFLFKGVKKRLPYFRKMEAITDSGLPQTQGSPGLPGSAPPDSRL